METIDTQIGVGNQDVVYTEILASRDLGAKLQVRIVSDTYAFQSKAVVSRWDGTQWQVVHSLHHSQMQTAPSLCFAGKPKQVQASFKADRDQLLKVATAILE